jgi:hypothetical protein
LPYHPLICSLFTLALIPFAIPSAQSSALVASAADCVWRQQLDASILTNQMIAWLAQSRAQRRAARQWMSNSSQAASSLSSSSSSSSSSADESIAVALAHRVAELEYKLSLSEQVWNVMGLTRGRE